MNNIKQKLELTWIGKGQEPRLEPRILIEDPSKSYGDPNSDNMLIHGDNLLALKALEQDYTGKIKCIYIDPPFNTGAAFDNYDDNLEHSIWLNLMYLRTKILRTLLADNGIFIIHLDDSEVFHYKIVADEIFGRNNFVSSIAVRSSTPSGLKTTHREKTIIKQKDLLLVYKKSDNIKINPQYIKRKNWDSHFTMYYDKKNKRILNLSDVLKENNILGKSQKINELNLADKKFKNFYIENKDYIFRLQPTLPQDIKTKSLRTPNSIIEYSDSEGNINYAYNGSRFAFLSSSFYKLDDNSLDLGILLCDFWEDIDFQNTQNEGKNSFPAGKKPEKLISRIIELFSDKGDIVLDSFLGSGTTASVAHKLERKWIGIEIGNHADTHCLPRLINVIDGKDEAGITQNYKWLGGGGLKYYIVAESLLKKDRFGNWVIDEKYNPNMLAASMCKHMGFKYFPNSEIYWKQGQSTENDFIYTTTSFLTVEILDTIKEDMKPEETLLICSKSYDPACEDKYQNITIKKIPQSILGKCEFSKDNYDLNIIKQTEDIAEEQEEIQE